MKNNIVLELVITSSKILAFCVFAAGVPYAYIYHDPSVLGMTFSISGGLIGFKTMTKAYVDAKKSK